jgi:hypothetical protein
LDKAGCIGTTLARIIIIFFFISGWYCPFGKDPLWTRQVT